MTVELSPRSIHLVRPPVDTDTELDVLDTFEAVYGYFAVAAELWQLAGNEDRARAIEHLIERAHERDVPALDTDQIREAERLLSGLDTALKATLTDEMLLLPVGHIPEIRARSRYLDLEERRGALAAHAVAEAFFGVQYLQHALAEALSRGAHIVIE